MKNGRANEEFNTNVIPRMMKVLTHLIFYLLTSILGSTFFLYMVNSNNIADLHNHNVVDDTKMESITHANLYTDIFQQKYEESTVNYCFQIHMNSKKFPN